MKKKERILVADDEEIMRDVLSTLLSAESYAVDLAQNGSQALEMIRDKDYGVLLLDLMMPDMDGFQVLAELKKMGGRWESAQGIISTSQSAYLSWHWSSDPPYCSGRTALCG